LHWRYRHKKGVCKTRAFTYLTLAGNGFHNFILPLTARGFIYIATGDLIPKLHKEDDRQRFTTAFSAFWVG
jgi:zinc transporter ZupT